MEVVLIITAFVVVIVGLFVGALWIIRHPRHRGARSHGAGLVSAGFDQLWHPEAANARDIVDAEQRLVVPAPTPDDDRGIAGGRIRLDL
ncbi:MAG TPA: hypothetical protein PK282_02660 [Rhodoglobus sp.]|nr:hypothetical protein [Rhodoglobus sp.]